MGMDQGQTSLSLPHFLLLLPSLLSRTCSAYFLLQTDHQPRAGTTLNGLGRSTSIINGKKKCPRQMHRSEGGQFLSRSSLFPGDPNLSHIDKITNQDTLPPLLWLLPTPSPPPPVSLPACLPACLPPPHTLFGSFLPLAHKHCATGVSRWPLLTVLLHHRIPSQAPALCTLRLSPREALELHPSLSGLPSLRQHTSL